MAYINGNKPIVTDGLVYALDFGNPKSYTSGSNRARSLVFDTATTIVTGSTSIPVLSSTGLIFTGSQFIQRSASLSALDPNGAFTICAVVKANTSGTLFTQNSSTGNISGRFQSTSSLSTGFTLSSGDFSRIYTGNFTGSQHLTYRYNSGSIDTFINGIPVTASQANLALTGSGLTSTLFINSGSLPFSGSLSSFYVYNRALSADEIYQNFEIASTRYGLPFRPKPYTQDENVYKFLQTTGITDSNTVSAISTFVSGLKSAGLWNKMTAIYPFLTTSTGSQTVNLKDPGVLGLGLTGSFSASAAGLTPSSSTAYVDALPSNIPYPSINSASAHLSLVSYDVPQGIGFLAGNSAPALGGETIITSGSKIYHAFKTVGTSSFVPLVPSISNVEVMVVAGGGAGGFGIAGGGGAGGLIYSSSFSITPGAAIQVIVGAGGVGGSPGTNGQDSVFGTITATGGGRGGGSSAAASTGGSGGGGGYINATAGLGTIGQGNNGGTSAGGFATAGGGGAGSAGRDYNAASGAGFGGSGSYFPQFISLGGSPSGWFAGGGGGGYGPSTTTNGGIGGGGGGGGASSPFAGSTNTGGGGGGGGGADGASGGSGIVIVGYDISNITAITGSGTGLYLTDSAITGSVNSQFTAGITGSGTIGFLTVNRNVSSSFSIHKNNVSQSISIAASSSLPTDIFFNTAGVGGASSLPLPATLAYASIGAGLTTSEVSTYYNLVTQLQNNLKRQNTLLDNFSGAAAAYSLRRIGPSGYFGPAIRVRRDSDNALRDIGFTSDGQLDTVGLLDFVGVTGSGFVDTWYDQSGNNNNATQGTNANQPLIIVSGSVIYDNKKPGLQFDGSNDILSATDSTTLDISGSLAIFTVVSTNDGTGAIVGKNSNIFGNSSTKSYGLGIFENVLYFQLSNGTSTISTDPSYVSYLNNIPHLLSSTYVSSSINNNIVQNIDGTLAKQSTSTPVSLQNLSNPLEIGGNNIYYLNGRIQEILIYASDQSSNRTSIESNINTNYKIYGSATASFDPDYQSFITATGITQPTQSAALETLVSDLKSYGLWNKMKAIYPMVTDKNNRFAYSEEFDNGQWNKVGTVVTPNASPSPLGTTTGDSIIEDTSTGNHYFYQTIDSLITSNEYVASIYGRFNNRPWIAIETNAGARAWFNIQTGVTGSLTGSRSTITNIGSGWYRCALYFTSSVASGPQNIQYHLADTDNNLTYTGVSGTGSFMWGAQFENGNVLGPYRATTTVGFTTGSMLDQMKFNLRNPVDSDAGFRLTYSGSWNPGYSGNKPDGITAYADTKILPSTTFTNNNTHLGFYSRTDSNLGRVMVEIGSYSNPTSNLIEIQIRESDNTFKHSAYNFTTSRLSVTNTNSQGFFVGSRTSATSLKSYKNSTLLGSNNNTNTTNITGNNSDTIFISALNAGSNPIDSFSNRESAFTTIGDGLTDYEAKALYWIVQKYQTTLGRQVY